MQEIAFSVAGGSGLALSQPVTLATPLPTGMGGRRVDGNLESQTPLGGGATLTGTGRVVDSDGKAFGYFGAIVYADVAGTLFVEMSVDNLTWYPANGVAGVAVAAGATVTAKVPICVRFYRVRYVNGAGAQAVFIIATNYFGA